MDHLFVTPSAVTDFRCALAATFPSSRSARRAPHPAQRQAQPLSQVAVQSYGDELIDLAQFVQLFEAEGAQKKRPDLGWKTGLASDYGSRGDVGKAVLGARNLGTGLQRLVEYFPLIQDATTLTLDVAEDWASLNYKILDPDIWPRHQDAMYSLGVYAKLIQLSVPNDWDHVEVSVECESADACTDLSSIVGTQVSYGGHANSLRFPAAWLNMDMALLDPTAPILLQSLSRQLAQKRRQLSMAQRTRHVIFRDMGQKHIGQEKIANELGVTSRTLRRKLAAEGLSFQDLLDDCRIRSAAREMQSRRTISLSELALRLGYSEHSTFSRAFVRWVGEAPQAYRKHLMLN